MNSLVVQRLIHFELAAVRVDNERAAKESAPERSLRSAFALLLGGSDRVRYVMGIDRARILDPLEQVTEGARGPAGDGSLVHGDDLRRRVWIAERRSQRRTEQGCDDVAVDGRETPTTGLQNLQ